jgi:hypothetical protein
MEVIKSLHGQSRRSNQRFDRRNINLTGLVEDRTGRGQDFHYDFRKFIKNVKAATNHRELSFKEREFCKNLPIVPYLRLMATRRLWLNILLIPTNI